MAVEALYLEVFKDNSDRILKTSKIHPNSQCVISDFLPETGLMFQVAANGKIGALLIDEPTNVESTLYRGQEDSEGIEKTGQKLILMYPGEELYVWSTVNEEREMWFVFEPIDNEIKIPTPRIAAGV